MFHLTDSPQLMLNMVIWIVIAIWWLFWMAVGLTMAGLIIRGIWGWTWNRIERPVRLRLKRLDRWLDERGPHYF